MQVIEYVMMRSSRLGSFPIPSDPVKRNLRKTSKLGGTAVYLAKK